MVSSIERFISVLHRNRWDIIASILSVAVSGETKTHIMYKCNLSFQQIQTYLDLLLDKGLLREGAHERRSTRMKIFMTTDKGRAFLKAYSDLKAALSERKS